MYNIRKRKKWLKCFTELKMKSIKAAISRRKSASKINFLPKLTQCLTKNNKKSHCLFLCNFQRSTLVVFDMI